MSDRIPSPSSPASSRADLPLDWRVKLNYVQADYSAGGAHALFTAPRAIHHRPGRRWIAGACLDAAGSTRCKSCGALQPQLRTHLFADAAEAARVPAYPRMASGTRCPGSAIAAPRSTSRAIASTSTASARSSHPAQISARAQRNSRRAASTISVDFAPAVRAMAVQQAREARHRLAAAREARHHHGDRVGGGELLPEESLTLPGILGADLDTCPLPVTGGSAVQKSSWRDAAPHESSLHHCR